MKKLHIACLLAGAVLLSACGTNMQERAATGAATGLIIAGPVGAAVGAGVGAVVDSVDKQDGKKGN